jgi:hypothetical protein
MNLRHIPGKLLLLRKKPVIFLSGPVLIRLMESYPRLIQANKDTSKPSFDSVRGVFFEGEDLYQNAGFKSKNHIQIAIRNPNCIKGYFIPR